MIRNIKLKNIFDIIEVSKLQLDKCIHQKHLMKILI